MIALDTESSMLQLLLLLLFCELSAEERGELMQCSGVREPGSCYKVSETCKQEHTSRGRLETCFPPNQDRSVVGSSAGCSLQPCDQEVTNGVAPLVLGDSLAVTFNPVDPVIYDATISWTAEFSSHHTGYKIALLYKYTYEDRYYISDCTCLYTATLRNYTFYNLRYSHDASMRFEVTSLPYDGRQSDFIIDKVLSSPVNCQSFDTYNPLHCAPPAYGRVTNPQAVTELFLSLNGSLRMRLFLSWQPPDTNTTRYPLPSEYYLVLVDRSRPLSGNCGENPRCFKTSDTLNVTISPLDPNGQYEVIINAYVKCSGLEDEHATGCSDKLKIAIPRPPPLPSSTLPPSLLPSSTLSPSLLPSSTLSPSLLPSSTLSPSLLPSSILPPPPHTSTHSQVVSLATIRSTTTHTSGTTVESIEQVHAVLNSSIVTEQVHAVLNSSIVTGTVSVAVVLILMLALALIYLAVKKQHRRRKQIIVRPKPPEKKDSQRKIGPLKPADRKKDPLVLVIYSPDSPEEDQHYVLQHLLEDLGKYCRVECRSCVADKQSAPAWLERKVREASVVLCVCNAQFKREWDQEHTSLNPLVFSLVQLIYGTLNKSNPLSGKFATVLLRETEHECIPDYLCSTRNFLVDEVDAITRFVQGVPEYESSWHL